VLPHCPLDVPDGSANAPRCVEHKNVYSFAGSAIPL